MWNLNELVKNNQLFNKGLKYKMSVQQFPLQIKLFV